jgi:hypothetical protein
MQKIIQLCAARAIVNILPLYYLINITITIYLGLLEVEHLQHPDHGV